MPKKMRMGQEVEIRKFDGKEFEKTGGKFKSRDSAKDFAITFSAYSYYRIHKNKKTNKFEVYLRNKSASW